MSFLAPAGLALGALAVPLIALYFLKIRRRRVRVSSLLPWHALQQSEKLASPFQRFRRHLLLLLQLLLLALLALALARPYLETESAGFRSVVLVLDTSASMLAEDGSPTRLDEARATAHDIAQGLGPADEAMVVAAGPTTEVLLPFSRDQAEVHSALDRVRATEAEGSLREGLQLALSLARSRPNVEVVVLSDGGTEDLSSVPGGAEVRFLRMGTASANAGIVALDLRRSPANDLQRQLFVTVRGYGLDAAQASVEVYLSDDLVGLRTEPLPDSAPVSMVFDLPGDAAGDLHVVLDVPGDLLPADDHAWAVLTPAASRSVLLVGGDALTTRVLASDPRAEVQQISPGAATPEVLAAADCVVFGGAVPDGVDGLHYAVLAPQHGGPVGFGPPVAAPGVVGWRRTHPLLRFVSWEGVHIGRASVVTDLAGLVPLVDGDSGPLLLAGERHGGRVVQLAFDPLQSDLPLRVAWPVLLLNTVGWLTEHAVGATEARQLQTGAPFLLRLPEGAPDSASATGPGPGRRRVSVSAVVDAGLLRVQDTHRVGVYEARAGSVRARFAANLLSEGESRIAPRSGLGLQGSAAAEVSAASVALGRRELWRPLLLAALALLLLEWFAYHRRRAA